MKKMLLLIIVLVICNWTGIAQANAFNPNRDIVIFKKYPNIHQLKAVSDLIGYGKMGRVLNTYATGRTVSQGKLVNYVQRFNTIQRFKGSAQTVKLLMTGVDPLPPPRDPINATFPGPFADGEYILFLRKIPGTEFYQVTGGLQGVYPLFQGRTVSLYHEGFPDLHQLTVKQFQEKLEAE
ncbi:MAG: hypothetical protein ACO1OC_11660 [Tuberibacillus sp.]